MGFYGAAFHTNPLEAELKALIKNLQLAIQHNFFPQHIDTDAHETVRMFLTNNLFCDNIIFECRSLVNMLKVWELQNVYKNQVVDSMEKERVKSSRFDDTIVFVIPPVYVRNQFDADNL